MMLSDSIVLPQIAKRHFIRWLLSNTFLPNTNQEINLFDELRIHNNNYSIHFLNQQLWDKLTYNIKNKEIGSKSLSKKDISNYFNIDLISISVKFKSLNITELNLEILDKLVLRSESKKNLLNLYCILYSSSERRNRRRLISRRSSSLSSPELKPSKPSSDPLPLAIATPVQKDSTEKKDNKQNRNIFKLFIKYIFYNYI